MHQPLTIIPLLLPIESTWRKDIIILPIFHPGRSRPWLRTLMRIWGRGSEINRKIRLSIRTWQEDFTEQRQQPLQGPKHKTFFHNYGSDFDSSFPIGVVRLLVYLFNILPFTKVKICPIAYLVKYHLTSPLPIIYFGGNVMTIIMLWCALIWCYKSHG